MSGDMDFTMKFEYKKDHTLSEKEILEYVFQALEEKGYNPINQLVGFLLSGDPSYITSHKNARSLIRKFERDELLEVIVASYLGRDKDGNKTIDKP